MEMQPRMHKHEIAVRWIKSESGNTYLCPVYALNGVENPSDEQLKSICVEESSNPHNE